MCADILFNEDIIMSVLAPQSDFCLEECNQHSVTARAHTTGLLSWCCLSASHHIHKGRQEYRDFQGNQLKSELHNIF